MAETFAQRCAQGAARFAADMQAQSIHVGLGARDPRCVTCGEQWPCPTSLATQEADDARH